ncbi:methyl-accepting chemotaxis protein [Robertmurraya andreesenii]|uniref:Methyl-accepting chemotaxis protein n=1 Tax=Anoxybacillus andreesenii TaxID=1325932 RepID=A0ABT9V1L6_9BACL|nr:methyl-accepting chemotaxis protein [Robertmurraya andreesenii]MDQ0154787.1 methyl-accepting chemotaxis protein [Robertmurraya andreesenii]
MKSTVARKLYFGFYMIIAFMIIMGVLSQLIVRDIDKEYQNLIDDRVYKVSVVKDLMNSQKDQTIGLRGYLLYGDKNFLESYEEAQGRVADNLSKLESSIQSTNGKELLERLNISIDELATTTMKSIEAKSNGDNEKALMLAQAGRDRVEALQAAANELIDLQTQEMDKSRKGIDGKIKGTEIFIYIIMLVSFILSGIIASFISRSISKPINQVSDVLKHVAAGNLTIEPLKIKNRDEVGTMVNHLNQMIEDLNEVVTKVNGASLDVASQSQELSASSEESTAASQMLAEIAQTNALGSDNQLNVINKMSISVSEMTAGINRITGSSHEMLQANNKAADYVNKGFKTVETSSTQMNELNTAMDEISEIVEALSQKSDEISNITNIINGIADQTNLLALNAAIEAARAGEAGKGFAVVADEVRKLAEQSKDSSNQIAQMISSIQHGISEALSSIENGNKLVDSNLASTNETLQAFGLIEGASKDVTEKINTVATASEQMNAITEGILKAIEEVQAEAKEVSSRSNEASAATEEQVATMEQISASAENLAALSEHLQAIVATFKIK